MEDTRTKTESRRTKAEGRRAKAEDGRHTQLRWGVLTVAIVLFGATAGAATPPATLAHDACATLPGASLRVRLAVKPDGIPLDQNAIARVVSRVWNAEGVEITWVPDTPEYGWSDMDLLVQVRQAPIAGADDALAEVGSVGGDPSRVIVVSIGSTIARVARSLARELQVQPNSASHLLFAGGRQIVEQSLGYTVAHEIGHYLLAQRNHATSGLMRATYDPAITASRYGSLMRLDTKSRERLRGRFTLAATCR